MKVSSPPYMIDLLSFPVSVYFPDINHGHAAGDVGTIYRTMNGGLNM